MDICELVCGEGDGDVFVEGVAFRDVGHGVGMVARFGYALALGVDCGGACGWAGWAGGDDCVLEDIGYDCAVERVMRGCCLRSVGGRLG